MTARAFRAPRAILRTSLLPIHHEMHSCSYDFLFLLYDCGITPLWLADGRPIYPYFFPCTAKQIYQRAAFVTFSFILIPCKAKLIIYKSSILPNLTYCHLVWHNWGSSDSRKIERIHERALREVFNSHSESYENLLVRAELPSLLNRRLQDTAILMYKVKYGLAPSILGFHQSCDQN